MASVLESRPGLPVDWRGRLAWWPVAAGLLALYLPTCLYLERHLWNSEAYAHGPIVLTIVIWLFWRNSIGFSARPQTGAALCGWTALVLGLLVYAIGRSQTIVLLEAGSVIPVVGGLILALQGWAGLRRFWFPLLFLVFFVPLPGFVIDGVTGALKHKVSALVEMLLYQAGYPIGRNGVVLTIDQYQVLVSDACSGLNSMFSLSAMGLLYLYLMRYTSWARNGLLLLGVLPIAFAANIVRVVILVLITYHLGDEAGQGFLHGFAGMLLFVIALLMLFAGDWLLGRVPALRNKVNPA